MPKETCCQSFVKFFVTYVISLLALPLMCLAAPITRLIDKCTFEWFQSRNVCTPAEHRRKVTRVQDQVRAWNAGGRKTRMCTTRAIWNTWTVHALNKRSLAQIEVDHLHHVVEVDEARRVVTVEPGLNMGQLTSILIPRGWTIPVIPEFETLTVGGIICGTGIESNSTRVGLSGDAAVGYELVLSNGNVVNCSKDENSDLFYSVPWSHGTLGFLTAVKFPIIPAKKYVQVEYHATESFAEAKAFLETQDHEFVEGLAFGRRKFVVTHGNMTNNVDSRLGSVNHINSWYKPFWYKHVESFLQRQRGAKARAKVYVEYIPLRDYYHRHTRSYFWEAVKMFPYSTSSAFRYLIGWVFPIADVKLGKRIGVMFHAEWMYELAFVLNHVLQDFIVPIKHLEPALDFTDETVGIYPLWLCPCKTFKKPGMFHVKGDSDELYIDIGVYGDVAKQKRAEYHPEITIRKFEEFVARHGGVQFLYADSFMTREEFRRMFDMELYDAVRAKYKALEAFPDVYDKVSRVARQIPV